MCTGDLIGPHPWSPLHEHKAVYYWEVARYLRGTIQDTAPPVPCIPRHSLHHTLDWDLERVLV
jgi:hypothetical protein